MSYRIQRCLPWSAIAWIVAGGLCSPTAQAATAGLTVAGTTSYPNNGMRRIGTCELSNNLFRSLYTAVYDPTTGFAYFSTAGGAGVNPGHIIKVDCNGPLPVEVGSCQCATGEFNLNSGVLDTVNGYGYFGVLSTSPGRIAKIALGAGSAAPTYVNSTPLNTGENAVMGAVADVANGYAYFACATNPGTVVKISMSAGSSPPARIGTVTLNSGEGSLRRGVIDASAGYGYFATISSAPTLVAKIALGTGATAPTRIGVVQLESTSHNIGSAVIDSAAGYAYFGSYDTTSVPAKVYKMALGAGAASPALVATTPLNGVERELCSALIDPTAGYAFFGTDHTYPGKIYKLSLGAGSASPIELGTLALNSGASANPADGANVSNVVTVPPAAPLPWGEVFLQSAIYDTARGYCYFGTDSSPGQVVKVAFSQKSLIKATRVVLGETACVNDVRLYSHAASGNARLAIYDNASPKHLLWDSGSTANTAASDWLTIPVGTASLTLAPGTYWLAWQVDTTADVPGYSAGSAGDGFTLDQTYGTFPSSLSGETSTSERWCTCFSYNNTPMDQWRLSKFTAAEMLDASISGLTSDPDHDRQANLLEYAFNRDPRSPDSANPITVSIDHSTQDYLQVVYTRRKPPRDITYHVEQSTDLTNWVEDSSLINETGAVDDGNGITETVTTRMTTPLSPGNDHRFVRLRVTSP